MINLTRDAVREIGRKLKRMQLRRRVAEAKRLRAEQFVALGRRAWEAGVGLPAADALTTDIAGADAQEAALAARRAALEGERKGYEIRKQAETTRLGDLEGQVKERKTPVDADLAKRRAELAQAQREAGAATRRLEEIQRLRRALETPPADPPTPETAPVDPAKVAAQIEALSQERTETETRLSALKDSAAAAAVDVQGLEAQARELQAELDALAAERRRVMGEIDKALAGLRHASDAANKEATAIRAQRTGHLKELGTRLFASGTDEPALHEAMAAARTADDRHHQLQRSLDDLLAESKTMPRWTMVKFWATAGITLALVAILVARLTAPPLPRAAQHPEMSPAVALPREPVRADVTTEGGSVDLTGFATATFFSGTLPAAQTVTLSATATAETASDFRVTAEIFAPGPRIPYEIRINTGTAAPRNSVTVAITQPDSFKTALPDGYAIRVFAQILQDGGEEVLDSFEVVRSIVNDQGRIVAWLSPQAFTNQRSPDGTFEAIVTLASTRTGRLNAPQQRSAAPATALAAALDLEWLREIIRDVTRTPEPCTRSVCDFTPPVLPLKINSPFSPARDHYGTDYKADNGQAVSPVARGRVVRIGWDERPLATPNPRSGKKVRGWGRYVIVEHCDGSRTVYAHLLAERDGTGKLVKDSAGHLEIGQTVGPADIIGQADNTGGSSGPHLHMEYWPSGRGGHKSSTDPQLCQVYPE